MKSVGKGPGMLVLALLVILGAGLAAPPDAQATFTKRNKITINKAQVGLDGTAPTTLSSYPFLYNVTDLDLRTTANSGDVTDAQGDDIIFRAFDADNPGASICGSESVCTLDHEIEEYNGTTGKLVAWVNIPVLNTQTASSNTVIYIYYGNSDITTSTQNATGVWDANYLGVWHLKENPSASTDCAGGAGTKEVCDSTINNLDGDANGGMVAGDQVAGQINGSLDFASASSQNVDMGDVNALDGITALTVTAWVKPVSLSASETTVGKFNDGATTGWRMAVSGKAIYNTSGTFAFRVPPGITSLTVKAWGAGAGGGGGGSNSAAVGGHGGGGGYSSSTISVTPGEDLDIEIGGGGVGGTGPGSGGDGAAGGGGGATVAGGGVGRNGCQAGGGSGGGGGYAAVKRAGAFLVQAAGGGGGGGGSNGSSETGGAGGAGGGTNGVQGSNAPSGGFGGGFGTASAGGAGGATGSGGGNGAAGSANTGGAGGTAASCGAAGTGGGGGGAGLFGGGGGGGDDDGGGGGGGGSSFGTTKTAGAGQTPGNNTDADYAGSAGVGGTRGAGSGGNATAGNPGRVVLIYGTNSDVQLSFDSNTGETSGNILANNTFGHWVTVFDGSQTGNANRLKFYLNGAEQTLTFSGTIPATTPSTTQTLRMAGTTDNSDFYDGILDEVRISTAARDQHWIKTEYNNMNSPLTFCTPDCGTEAEEDNPPSAVKLRGARAVAYEGAFAQTVQLKWRTSHEVDHLGFYVYREQAGQLLKLTPSLLAGSALLARGRTELTAGQRYSWWDVLPAESGPLQYWLEEIDLHGKRTWHGPIAVKSAKGRRDIAGPEQVRSVLLSKLGRGKHKGRLPGAPWQGAADATTQTPTAAQLAMQAQLAAGPAIKLGVSAEGWYRVDQPTLIAAGLDPKVDPRRLRLYADGIEVPMVVTGAKDKRLQPRDAIEFYAVGLDTPWTDTRTYWLVEGQQAGQRMSTSAWRGRTQSGPASFPYTVTWQPRELYFAALRNGEADNFFGPVVGNWATEQAFTLNHLDPAPPGAARLEVTLQGATDGPHLVDVQVNGNSVGTVTFDGQAQGRADLSVPASQLQAGANVVTLIALGGELDYSLVATVRLTYWHTYQAEEDVLRGSVPAGLQVTIGGFSTKPISVVDVTEPDAVRAVPGQVKRQGNSFAVTVVGPGPGTRTLLAFTDRIAATPAKIYANQPSRWHSDGHRADLVMIGHPTVLPSLANLKAWREQQGLRVALIDVEDLYDEFTFGAKSPWALRALVETARASWAQPPRFLLLGGDASVDPRDTQLMGETDFVPTKLIDTDMMETASDDWFGDLNGDGVAEVAVGRLAVRTAEEAATVVQKLIGYDQTAAARTAVLVADTPDSLDFEGASTQLAALLPSGMATQAIYRSQSDDATTRGALLSALNSGAWLVNYLGHGSVEVWRGEVFTSLDASALTNGLRLPFVSTMTCLNGFFHDVYTESLAEALQRAPQGGALAVWASSSLSVAADQVDMNRALLKGLSAGLTLGEAVAQAKTVSRNQNVRRSWILFGDPTTRLR